MPRCPCAYGTPCHAAPAGRPSRRRVVSSRLRAKPALTSAFRISEGAGTYDPGSRSLDEMGCAAKFMHWGGQIGRRPMPCSSTNARWDPSTAEVWPRYFQFRSDYSRWRHCRLVGRRERVEERHWLKPSADAWRVWRLIRPRQGTRRRDREGGGNTAVARNTGSIRTRSDGSTCSLQKGRRGQTDPCPGRRSDSSGSRGRWRPSIGTMARSTR